MTVNTEEAIVILDAVGGTAFPLSVVLARDPKTGAPLSQHNWTGMTLRDWFAGQALNALAAQMNDRGNDAGLTSEQQAAVLARTAYAIAIAMIAARKGGAA